MLANNGFSQYPQKKYVRKRTLLTHIQVRVMVYF